MSAAEALYRQAPTNYLSHLLGHEGAGSAFALLKVGKAASNSKFLLRTCMGSAWHVETRMQVGHASRTIGRV